MLWSVLNLEDVKCTYKGNSEYWCSLLKTDNWVLQTCWKQLFCEYEKQKGNCTNWIKRSQEWTIFYGLRAFLGTTRSLRCRAFFISCGTASYRCIYLSCFSVFEKSSKCIVYIENVDKFCLQKYRKKNVEKSVLHKYRICAQSFKSVEKGRYKNLSRIERKCLFCSEGEMEDEFNLFANVINDVHL